MSNEAPVPVDPITGKRFLVVDDDVELVKIISRILTRAGGHCLGVNNASDALLALHSGAFHAIISDVMMPGQTGLEMLAWIRKQGNQIPCLLASGTWGDHQLETARQLGAYVLDKPCSNELLLDKVRAMMFNAGFAPAAQTPAALPPVAEHDGYPGQPIPGTDNNI